MGRIALRLAQAPGTVRNYRSEASDNLSASNRSDAVRIARDTGWL
jgi:DNA-binding NarL/FixJ family response regulator